MGYTGETGNFLLRYMEDGDTSSGSENEFSWGLLDGILQRCLDAIGEGVISGGVGSVVGADLALTALVAIIADETGGVPVGHEADTLLAAEFAEGTNYVHCQLTETSRTDGSCEYYIDTSPTPASDAITICQVTVTGGAVTAVDNTVKLPPALAERIPWEVLHRSYDDDTTLLAFLTAALGADYVGETPPADVDTRLTALEAGGGGGGGTVFWGALEKGAGDPTTIEQRIVALIAEHVAAVPHGGGGGGGEAVVLPWDIEWVNQAKHLMMATRWMPDMPATQVDSIVIVEGSYGDGSGGSPDWIDREHSTWV